MRDVCGIAKPFIINTIGKQAKNNKSIELKHISRLIERNRLLAECLAEERKKRKDAYGWYQKRLANKLSVAMDVVWAIIDRFCSLKKYD